MIVVVIWELAYRTVNFASPLKVANSLYGLAKDNTLGIAVAISLRRIITGYLISLIIGLALGGLMVKLRGTAGSGLSKLVAALQTMPNVCWVPFAVLWFGKNEKAILFVIIIGSVFAVSMATEAGINNLNPTYLRVAQMTGARGVTLFKEVIFPAAIPIIVSGLKQGWAFAWRGLIAGEMISSMSGLGEILNHGKQHNDINEIVAVMVVIVIIGLIVDRLVFENIENRVGCRFGFNKN